ncbi:hypothetical protein Ddye_021835 [Dipteronia dyeriana]|uniref:Reverse transcriptase RNase H-like domain-containing protein n=1 Tax=Dipteronia dyeriana TaxID=168575 RepID=A0AAD9U2E3_9ROSI|nr:hypothetical protein Ddye_021835 [Dipteronia dyeriana]
MQKGHPIAFESHKLSDTERRYTVQEKEMTAIIHCLRVWRHYLLGATFVIITDNVATSYFQTQKKLSPKQARWKEIIKECHDSKWAGHPGMTHTVALLQNFYYWPQMLDDVNAYVRTCLLLDVAQFSFNLQRSEATGKSPFEIVMGQQPMTPQAIASTYRGKSYAAHKLAREWHEEADIKRACLDKAAQKMKKWVDTRR